MTRYLLSIALGLGLALGIQAAEIARPARFGLLESMSPETAKKQALAWLTAAGKTDAASKETFDKIWREDASVLEKVTRTFELGNPAVAKLLAEARDPSMPAPVAVPELLKETKDNQFLRANLTLAYARALCNRHVHEEALAIFKLVQPELVVDPAAYLFHRALSEHALLQKAEALNSINRLLDDVSGSPERYRTLAALMALDMHTWSEKDLSSIARKMKNVERRLDLARGGPQTQKIQKEIVARLDEMIKELENKKKGGGGSGSGNGGACPPGGSGPPQGNNPSSPATESGIANAGGSGAVDSAKLKKLIDQWGSLPPREQAKALQELTQGMSTRHREAIENYFRNLAAAQSRSK